MSYEAKAIHLLAALALLVSPSAVVGQTCSTECGTRDTTADFSIDFDGRCTTSNVAAKITDAADIACLICLYDTAKGTTGSTLADVTTALCTEGYAANVFPFADITRKGAEFDNEHYAGGGEWNYEVETASGEDRLEDDARRVDDVYYYQARRQPIEFPTSTIESFNPYVGADNTINGIVDMDGCDLNAAYCCFAQDRQAGDNNGNCATPYEYNCHDKDPADNANVCYVDHSRSSKSSHVDSGFSIYGDLQNNKENIEGSIHCHGFAWGDDPLSQDNVYKGNLLFYVSMYDHLTQRGYARNIPGSPMCACAENMVVATRADCTQVAATEETSLTWTNGTQTLAATPRTTDIAFNACQGSPNNNNLADRVTRLHEEGHISAEKKAAVDMVLVGSEAGKCNDAIEGFLNTKGITVTP